LYLKANLVTFKGSFLKGRMSIGYVAEITGTALSVNLKFFLITSKPQQAKIAYMAWDLSS
jgi:hypothetical protein